MKLVYVCTIGIAYNPMSMSYKLNKKEKETLKKFADKLPVFLRVDFSGEKPTLMECRVQTIGAEFIKMGITEFKYQTNIKGPGRNNIVKVTKTEVIDPKKYYWQNSFIQSDPYKFLEDKIKKYGPDILNKAHEEYLKENEVSIKLQITLAHAQLPKSSNAESKVEVQPE
jgi:hypothetical protein